MPREYRQVFAEEDVDELFIMHLCIPDRHRKSFPSPSSFLSMNFLRSQDLVLGCPFICYDPSTLSSSSLIVRNLPIHFHLHDIRFRSRPSSYSYVPLTTQGRDLAQRFSAFHPDHYDQPEIALVPQIISTLPVVLITFRDQKEAEQAKEALLSADFEGKMLSVTIGQSQHQQSPFPFF